MSAAAPALPSIGLLRLAPRLLRPGSERIEMRSWLERQYRELGPVVAQDLIFVKMVNLFGPDANRLVLLDKDRIFSARKPWMQIMGRIFPDGLLLLDGEQHKHHRKIMHTAFTRPALREYGERMGTGIAAGIEGWGASRSRISAFHAYKTLTLDLAASIFLGENLGPGTRAMNTAFEDLVGASMSRIRLRIPGLEFYRGLKAREFMVDFLGSRIAQRRESSGRDMFTRLTQAVTEEGERFADQEIVDHMSFLMMAAHDTTTSTLTSMTYELGRHPDWQQRLREESLAFGEEAVSFDRMGELRGLGMVLKEAIRMYPPLPVIPRVATEAFEFEGYRIPANSMVVVAPIVTHYLEEWWDEPKRFDPDRFSEARAEDQRHSHSYIPFGGGPHMCLGRPFAELQVKAILHEVLRRYRWTLPRGYQMPVQQAPISKPRDGLPVKFRRLD